ERFQTPPVFVRTKEGLGRFAGKMYFEERLQQEFVEGARRALDRKETFAPLPLSDIFMLDIDFVSTVVADAVSVIPGLKRTGGRSVLYQSTDMRNVYRMIHAVAMLGSKFAVYT
ncbi:MAG: M55 family metallopeptidase, partial [Desulfomonilaceae bacterium]